MTEYDCSLGSSSSGCYTLVISLKQDKVFLPGNIFILCVDECHFKRGRKESDSWRVCVVA